MTKLHAYLEQNRHAILILWIVSLALVIAVGFVLTQQKSAQWMQAYGGTKFEARIPDNAGAMPPPLRDGSQDVTFRVPPEAADKVRAMAGTRNRQLKVWVQP